MSAAAQPAAIAVERRIEWVDTDASGHYHFTAALRLFESAEAMLLDRLGLRDRIYGRLPRVRLLVDFHDRLVFGDMVTVDVRVRTVGRTSLTYNFEIARGGNTCTSGQVTAVLLDSPLGRPTRWPEDDRARLCGAGRQASEHLQTHALKGTTP